MKIRGPKRTEPVPESKAPVRAKRRRAPARFDRGPIRSDKPVTRHGAGLQSGHRQVLNDVDREMKVFALFRSGQTTSEIAASMGVTIHTVNGLIEHAFRDYIGDARVMLQRDYAKIAARVDLIIRSWELEACGGVRINADGTRTIVEKTPEAAKVYLSALQRMIQLIRPAQQHIHIEAPGTGPVQTAQVSVARAAELVRAAFPNVRRKGLLHSADLEDGDDVERVKIVDMQPEEVANDGATPKQSAEDEDERKSNG